MTVRLRTRPLVLSLVLGLGGCPREAAPVTPAASTAARPRLAVVLVVDQMRADYLTRYADLYRGGLARLRERGAWFVDAHIQHALTYTAPGHASVATGSHPARHGIIANEWYDRAAGAEVYAAADADAAPALTVAPGAALPGRSPRLLARPGLGDWLKGQEPKARVFSVALKDRSAIMMGGQRPDRAYWYHPEVAGFGSSTYYQDGAPPPAWVASFNAAGAVFDSFARGWTRSLDLAAYLRSGPDRVDAEADGVHTEFPHLYDDGTPAARAAFARDVLATPFGDQLNLAFARALVEAEQLGADDVPDILFVSCSSADMVGHAYGPFSHEVQDYYLRLDAYLGEFLADLDERVGADNYVLALTADHGALPLPEEARLRGHRPARRVVSATYRPAARAAVTAALTRLGLPAEILRDLGSDGVWLHTELARHHGVQTADLRAAVAEELRGLDFVADAFTADELADDAPGRPFLARYRRSFFPERSPDVQLRFKEWHLVDAQPHGTSHGSPYRYDTHVPVLFYGAGVRPGAHPSPAGTVDVAPTLAAMLGIVAPPDLDGRSLAALVRGR